jgi:hypothetical protein
MRSIATFAVLLFAAALPAAAAAQEPDPGTPQVGTAFVAVKKPFTLFGVKGSIVVKWSDRLLAVVKTAKKAQVTVPLKRVSVRMSLQSRSADPAGAWQQVGSVLHSKHLLVPPAYGNGLRVASSWPFDPTFCYRLRVSTTFTATDGSKQTAHLRRRIEPLPKAPPPVVS